MIDITEKELAQDLLTMYSRGYMHCYNKYGKKKQSSKKMAFEIKDSFEINYMKDMKRHMAKIKLEKKK